VDGEATVYAEPDNVRVHVGVLTVAAELAQARGENARASQAILEAIEALKYPDVYIKSVAFDLSAIMEERIRGELKPPRIIGYQVRNRIAVRLTNASPAQLSQRAASVLDAAAAQGANDLGDIEVFVLDQDAHRQEALLKAVSNARDKAEAIAKALDVRIVGYQNVAAQDVRHYGYRPHADNVMLQMAAPAGGDGVGTPIEAGLIQISARVSLQCIIR
jgi:hypothetical protein